MNEGFKKGIKKEIKYWEDLITEKQKEESLTEEELNEILEKLDSLYELLNIFD